MMQWCDHTAGLQAHMLRAHGQRRVQHGGCRVRSAERREVALGKPDAAEAMRVDVPRHIQQQPIAIARYGRRARREKHHAESEGASGRGCGDDTRR